MYQPKHQLFQFNIDFNPYQFMQKYSFATLISSYQGEIEINQIPFVIDQDNDQLLGHLARTNPHWQHLTQADDVKVFFNGPDAYISPNWYQQPKQNVPTWNYVSLEVSGKVSLMSDQELIDQLAQLSQIHESTLETPWTIDLLEPKQLDRMCQAIVGIKISIDRINSKAKLSQNKSVAELKHLIEGLASQTESDNSQQIRHWMQTQNGC
jgi:transcriptional regulator